jgi:hypothetical protein
LQYNNRAFWRYIEDDDDESGEEDDIESGSDRWEGWETWTKSEAGDDIGWEMGTSTNELEPSDDVERLDC